MNISGIVAELDEHPSLPDSFGSHTALCFPPHTFMGTPNTRGVDEGLAWSQTQYQKCLTPPVQGQQISKSPERLKNLTVTAILDGQSPTTSELARGRTDDQ